MKFGTKKVMSQSPGLKPRIPHPDETMEPTVNFHDREILA